MPSTVLFVTQFCNFSIFYDYVDYDYDYVSSNQTQKNPDHFTPFSSEDEDVDYDYDYVSSNHTLVFLIRNST